MVEGFLAGGQRVTARLFFATLYTYEANLIELWYKKGKDTCVFSLGEWEKLEKCVAAS